MRIAVDRRARHPAAATALWAALLVALVVLVALEVRAVAVFSIAGS